MRRGIPPACGRGVPPNGRRRPGGGPRGHRATRTGYRDGVYRFLLSPRWIAAHLALVVAVATCLILGSWQADAFRESKARHDARDSDPTPLGELVSTANGAEVEDAVDRAVVLRGAFDPATQVFVPGRVHNDTLGSYVVTVLREESGLDIPVLRGWLDDVGDAGTTVPSGTVEVTGHLLAPETQDKAVVRSDRPLEDDQIGYIAPHLIADAAPEVTSPRLLDGFVVLTGITPEPTAEPIRVQASDVDPIRDVSPWQNASYWAQWWVFGLAAVVFWASAVRAAVRNRRAAVTEPDRAPAPS